MADVDINCSRLPVQRNYTSTRTRNIFVVMGESLWASQKPTESEHSVVNNSWHELLSQWIIFTSRGVQVMIPVHR